MFSSDSLLLFRGSATATHRATLMLSFGKLMKMCGVFISCESPTNHTLIAPFFVVLLGEKNHFHIKLTRSCEVHHLWTFYSRPSLPFPQWLYNRKWRINIWDDQTQQTVAINYEQLSKHAVNSPRLPFDSGSRINCFPSTITGVEWLFNLRRHLLRLSGGGVIKHFSGGISWLKLIVS